MPIRSWSLTRLLEKGVLRSLDEEDLEALTVAIVLEVASRRQVTLPVQPDEQGNWSCSENSPISSEDGLDILQMTDDDGAVEIQTLQARLADLQDG